MNVVNICGIHLEHGMSLEVQLSNKAENRHGLNLTRATPSKNSKCLTDSPPGGAIQEEVWSKYRILTTQINIYVLQNFIISKMKFK